MPLRTTSIVAAPVIALAFAVAPAVAHGDSTDWASPGEATTQGDSHGEVTLAGEDWH